MFQSQILKLYFIWKTNSFDYMEILWQSLLKMLLRHMLCCCFQIVHKMSHAVYVDASLARLEERSRQAQINDESTCDSCYARLGTKLFAMYPDDSVVCYKVRPSFFTCLFEFECNIM